MMTMMVMTQKSGVGDVIAKIVIVSPRIAFSSKEMEVKTCNRVSSMQLRGLYEEKLMVKKHTTAQVGLPKFGSGSERFGSGSKGVQNRTELLFYLKRQNTIISILDLYINFDTGSKGAPGSKKSMRGRFFC